MFRKKIVFAKIIIFAFFVNQSFSRSALDSYKNLMNRILWTQFDGIVSVSELLSETIFDKEAKTFEYDSACDDGFWISLFLEENKAFIEENFIVPNGNFSEQDMDVLFAIQEASLKTQEALVLDSSGFMHSYSFGTELFSYRQENQYKKRIVLSGDEKRFVRRFYDENMNLSKKELWTIFSSNSSKPDAVYEYIYSEDGKKQEELITTQKEKHILTFNEEGLCIESKNYELEEIEDSAKNSKESKKFIYKSITQWKYGTEKKVTEKTTTEFEYSKKKKNPVKTSVRKEVYEYKIQDEKPDYFLYEDGILRIQTLYSDTDTFIKTLYFDGGFVVESYYENSLHKKDVYYLNGIQKRVKEYEKMDS